MNASGRRAASPNMVESRASAVSADTAPPVSCG